MNTFIYYYDIINNDYYLNKEDCDLYNITINNTNKKIDEKNIFKIDKEELNKLIKEKNLKYIEKIIILDNDKPNYNSIIIIYEDDTNHNLYIPEEFALDKSAEQRIIMNKKCYKLLDKSPYPTTVTVKITNEVKKEEIIVCTINNKQFINRKIIKKHLKKKDRQIIRVNNTIYKEVSNKELDTIKEIYKSNDIELSFIKKPIYKKNK